MRRENVRCDPPGTENRRCDVMELAIAEFGEKVGPELLLEYTCFPFSCEHAMPQLRDLVQANRMMGRLAAFTSVLSDEQERTMYENAGIEWPGASLAPVGYPQRRTADGWVRG